MGSDDDQPWGGPPPEPSERAWRHPSELAASRSGDTGASNETAPLAVASPSRRAWWASLTLGSATVIAVCLTAVGVVSMASGDGNDHEINADELNADGDAPTLVPATAPAAVTVGSIAPSASSTTTLASAPTTTPTSVNEPPMATSPGIVAVYGVTGEQARPMASGIVIDGLILTSAAALEGEDSFELTLDGVTFRAELAGSDRYSDLAVLIPTRVPTELIPVNTIPPDASSAAGDPVSILAAHAIAQPELSMGEVVAIDEQLTTADGHHLIGAVLTTVRRIEGADGAALVDTEGNTIAIVVSSATYHAVAIPLHNALSIGRSIAAGEPSETWIGIAGADSDQGIEITKVQTDGPAGVAGLQVGDIVTAVDGVDVRDMGALVSAMRTIENPERIELSLVRQGDPLVITVSPNGERLATSD